MAKQWQNIYGTSIMILAGVSITAKAKPLRELFEEKARAGDRSYAIACALLDLSDSQEATAIAIQKLGNGNASTHFGAIEGLAMKIEQAAEIMGAQVGGIADAICLANE